MHVRAGTTSGLVYTTALFGQGALGYGNSQPLMPSELERNQSAGNGGGQDILHYRNNEIIHPNGFAFLSAGIAQGISATRTQLEAAAQWDRIYTQRKNVRIAFLRTNG